jgi:hypothetical protein
MTAMIHNFAHVYLTFGESLVDIEETLHLSASTKISPFHMTVVGPVPYPQTSNNSFYPLSCIDCSPRYSSSIDLPATYIRNLKIFVLSYKKA